MKTTIDKSDVKKLQASLAMAKHIRANVDDDKLSGACDDAIDGLRAILEHFDPPKVAGSTERAAS